MRRFAIWSLLLVGTAAADDLAAAKAKFIQQDKDLNAAYTKLKTSLSPELFAEVREDQRAWIDLRDLASARGHLLPGEGEEAKDPGPEKTAEYWETAASLTEERTRWLGAWRNGRKRESWPGRYSDGRSGGLEIAEKDGKFWFKLSFAQGVGLLHLGELGGVLRVDGSTAWFENSRETKAQPAKLSFVREGSGPCRIKIVPENRDVDLAGRHYLWIGELDPAEQKKVIEPVTEK